MPPQIILLVVIAVAICITVTVWKIGRRFPTQAVREKIETETLSDTIITWYAGREWKCVKAISDDIGPFGMPIPIAVLENGDERIRLCYDADNIIGRSFKLEPRKRNQPGVWVSAVDKIMRPVPFVKTGCRHQYEVSSPIDTVVMTGLYPFNSFLQTFSIIVGTTIAVIFAIYIGVKWKSFR